MPQIKICGVTRPVDAANAVRAGADAIGLQFFDKSVRSITLEEAVQIRKEIPPFVSTVGVFVNLKKEDLMRVVDLVGLDYVQLHGNEDPDYIRDLPVRVIKTVRVGSREDLKDVGLYPADVLLLDAKIGDQLGGTGKTFDWSLLDDFTSSMPIMLAGGLCAKNVEEAIIKTKPQVVDLCSGVESEPRIKSYEKMREFVKNVRKTEL